jgi:hypothetical protein
MCYVPGWDSAGCVMYLAEIVQDMCYVPGWDSAGCVMYLAGIVRDVLCTRTWPVYLGRCYVPGWDIVGCVIYRGRSSVPCSAMARGVMFPPEILWELQLYTHGILRKVVCIRSGCCGKIYRPGWAWRQVFRSGTVGCVMYLAGYARGRCSQAAVSSPEGDNQLAAAEPPCVPLALPVTHLFCISPFSQISLIDDFLQRRLLNYCQFSSIEINIIYNFLQGEFFSVDKSFRKGGNIVSKL